MPGFVSSMPSKQTKPLPMPTVGGTFGGGLGKQTPRVGQGGIGQPGGMIPPPRNGGSPGSALGPVMGGGKFAMRPAQPSMAQPRARPMTRPGMGLT